MNIGNSFNRAEQIIPMLQKIHDTDMEIAKITHEIYDVQKKANEALEKIKDSIQKCTNIKEKRMAHKFSNDHSIKVIDPQEAEDKTNAVSICAAFLCLSVALLIASIALSIFGFILPAIIMSPFAVGGIVTSSYFLHKNIEL